jgi:hypothetical protein
MSSFTYNYNMNHNIIHMISKATFIKPKESQYCTHQCKPEQYIKIN